MLRCLRDLEGYTVSATDGDIGSVVNFLLDDERWTIRYLVAEPGGRAQTGGFFEGRRVLISPVSFRHADWSTRRFHVALTMAKVKNSPSIDVDLPVSRQHERDYYRYYGYPHYWGYSGLWGMGACPGQLAASEWSKVLAEHPEESGDVHLRSAGEVRGYTIQGSDEPIGHVEDFIVDDKTWAIHYLVIDTSNWWFGKKVLIAPQWASRVSWGERSVYVHMSRQEIKNSPEWNPNAAVNREYEVRLYDYHGRPAYWGGDYQPPPDQSASQPG